MKFVKLIKLPCYLIGMLPYTFVHRTMGGTLYFVAYRLLRYRHQVIVQNISRSFPEMDYAAVKVVTKNFYRHFSSLVVDSVYLVAGHKKACLSRANFVNTELLQPYIADKRQIICLLGHYGNWELLNTLPVHLSCPVNAAYRPLSNATMDRLMRDVRGRFGLRPVPEKHILRHLVRNREIPQFSFFIADQYPGKNNGVTLQFLNQSTSMFSGAEKLARSVDAVVCYLDMAKRPDGIWDIRFSLLSDSGVNTVENEITKAFSARLQQSISENPAWWLWSHRRWK